MILLLYTSCTNEKVPVMMLLGMELLSEIRIRFQIRSGSDPKIRISGGAESGYPEEPNPDPDSKMLLSSKQDSDPNILIF